MTGPSNDVKESVTGPTSQLHRSSLFGSFSTSKTCKPDLEMIDMACQMVDGLTDDEKEYAARSSYAYLWKSVTSHKEHNLTSSKELLEERDLMARAMAMQFLKSKKGNLAVATQ
jgi:hypothetical protein